MINLRNIFVVGTLVVASILPGCGGDSDNGSPVITGTLSQAVSSRNDDSSSTTEVAIANAQLAALGQNDTTDSDGRFTLRGDASNVPARTLVEVTIPAMTMARESRTERFVVNTSGSEFPLEISATRLPDGSYLIVAASKDTEPDDIDSGTVNIPQEDETAEDDSNNDSNDTTAITCLGDSDCPTGFRCESGPGEFNGLGTCSEGTRGECDPAMGAIEFNPSCPPDLPFCPNGACVQCVDDAVCGPASICNRFNQCEKNGCEENDECLENEECVNFVCVPEDSPVTCETSDMICSGGGDPLCVSSCRCDDGFPIGDCTATCFDTGSTPTECDSGGIGCPSGESMVCPQ